MAFLIDECIFVPLTKSLTYEKPLCCGNKTELVDYIKQWICFSYNKSACRYLIVDAYNNDKAIAYYQRNNFDFIFSSEEQEMEYRVIDSTKRCKTRLMYFDLIRLLK